MKNINWKQAGVALASLLAGLSALPYTIGELSEVIPPSWKPKVFVVSVISAFLLRFWNSASKTPPQAPPTTTGENKP